MTKLLITLCASSALFPSCFILNICTFLLNTCTFLPLPSPSSRGEKQQDTTYQDTAYWPCRQEITALGSCSPLPLAFLFTASQRSFAESRPRGTKCCRVWTSSQCAPSGWVWITTTWTNKQNPKHITRTTKQVGKHFLPKILNGNCTVISDQKYFSLLCLCKV